MIFEPVVRRLSILDKYGNVVKLSPNPVQEVYLDRLETQFAKTGRGRVIVLKARQMGLSTITEACIFTLAMMCDNWLGYIIAHEVRASQGQLAMTQRYWQTSPYYGLLSTRFLSQNTIAWAETGSAIQVATAGSKNTGRSRTINGTHITEFAFWPNASETYLGIRQSVPNAPNTLIAIESTANGQGNAFHKMWEASVAGDSEFEPLFFPWTLDPLYRASVLGLAYKNLGQLDSEERVLRKCGVDDDQLAWRRWAVINLADNDLRKFQQEYPFTAEEAFISTGTNVFPLAKLQDVYERQRPQRGRLQRLGSNIRFVEDSDGPLMVWRMPARDADWGQYVIGADATWTTVGDYAVAQVLSRRTLEQVAELRMRCDSSTFGEELFALGLFYNKALLAVEKTGPGALTIGKLLGLRYPRLWQPGKIDSTRGPQDVYGWHTSVQSKAIAVGHLLKAVVDGINPHTGIGLKIHDQGTYEEMRFYVTLDNGGYGNADDSIHDDRVMALAIATTCHMMEPPLPAWRASDSDVYSSHKMARDLSTISKGGVPTLDFYDRWEDE